MNDMYKLIFVFRTIKVHHGNYNSLEAALSAAYFHAQYVGADEIIIYTRNNEIAIIRG